MSDTAKKPAAAAPAAEKKEDAAKPAKGGMGGLLKKTPVLLGAVMLIEGVVLIAGLKFIGGAPRNAAGAEIQSDKSDDKGDGKSSATDKTAEVEIQLVDFRAPNKANGRTFLYDVAIFVTTKSSTEDRVKELISAQDALIKDRVRTIIAQMDPEKLGGGSEPGLETLRRQVKYQLDQIIPNGMIDEVLVPRCIPFRTDY